MKNISRRWLLKSNPIMPIIVRLEQGKTVVYSSVRTGYLIDKKDAEVAVHQRDDLFFLTVNKLKSASLVDHRPGLQICQATFESLWEETEGRRFECTLYSHWLSGNHLSMLVCRGKLQGICLLQWDFSDDDQAMGFILPFWAEGSVEVTSDPRYSDKNLALHPEAVDPKQLALV